MWADGILQSALILQHAFLELAKWRHGCVVFSHPGESKYLVFSHCHFTQSQLKLFCFNEQVYFSCPHHLLWCKLNSQFASLPQRHTVFNQSRYVIRDLDWLLSLDFYYLESFGGQFCFLCFGSDLESFGGQFFFSFVLALLDLKQRQGYILSKDLW